MSDEERQRQASEAALLRRAGADDPNAAPPLDPERLAQWNDAVREWRKGRAHRNELWRPR